ncbi:hypothetical protein ARMSODRAFT_192624 [Armillaria solidipes]|uniref:Uncharacterized protein n=1 Tax=Armillaria solidipes TaxID=1076256 RepID=A0A2H3BIM6_9AGAR|nr:hypothetical protein ARMSODRAFT_192624 [Armillaria solidipes]
MRLLLSDSSQICSIYHCGFPSGSRHHWTSLPLCSVHEANLFVRSEYLVAVLMMWRVNERLVPLRRPGLRMVVLLERDSNYHMICCFGKFESS